MAAMPCTRYQPTNDKIMRLHAQTAMIENGFVHIPETAPWLAEYLHELTVFPNGKHDDQVDLDRSVPRLVQAPVPGPGLLRAHADAGASARAGAPTRNPLNQIGPSAAWNGRPSRRKPS